MPRCELCGRAYKRKSIVPYWVPFENVCDRRNCRAAVADSVRAVQTARERNRPLVDAIARRHESAQHVAMGWRQDSMAEIDVVEGREWWATEVVKNV